MDLKQILINLLKLFFILLVIFIAYQVLLAIFEGTWETENIIIAGMGIIFAGMFTIIGFLIQQGRMLGSLDEMTKHFGEGLFHLGRDFKEHVIHHHNKEAL